MKKVLCLPCLLAVFTVFAQTTDKMPGSDCSNVVIDQLKGAPNRSPSPCEVLFDMKVRVALREAFGHLIRKWAEKDWIVHDTDIIALKGVSRASEKNFFELPWYFNLELKQESVPYSRLAARWQAVSDSVGKYPGEESGKKLMSFIYIMNNAAHIRIYVSVNDPYQMIYFYNGGQQQFNVTDASYSVKGSYSGSLSGGGKDNAMDAALIVFGKNSMRLEKNPDGSQAINFKSIFPLASHLTIQTIYIRIECNEELLKSILKEIDFSSIAAMIGH